jgi:hypothetical protein
MIKIKIRNLFLKAFEIENEYEHEMDDAEHLNQNEEINNQDEYMDENGRDYEELADVNGEESGLK